MHAWTLTATLIGPLVCSALDSASAQDPKLSAPGEFWTEQRTYPSASGRDVIAEVGRLAVPENRQAESSNLIELAFVRLRSFSDDPRPPLLYLAGGPGGSATHVIDSPRSLDGWLPALGIGDVILLDQRGTGRSTPRLTWRSNDAPDPSHFASAESMLERATALHRQAREALIARGIDLDGYTSVQSADDINDLRHALGYQKLSLMGFSYGTHLALATMRRHGSVIESAVLIGVEGPDHTYKLPQTMEVQFAKLAKLVAQDKNIGPAIPDLEELLEEVLFRLEDEPMVVEIQFQGTPVEVPVGPGFLLLLLRADIGDATDLPVFPRLLASIDAGDPRILQWFVQKRAARANGVNGMSMMMDGASGATAERLALIRAQAEDSVFGSAVNFPYPDINEVWNPPDLGDDYRSPLLSDIRTLFLTGDLDFNTPPFQAAEVSWGFTNATHLTVANAGHEQVLTHPEIRDAIVRFLRGEDVRGVVAAWPPLRFVPLEGFDPEVSHPSVPQE